MDYIIQIERISSYEDVYTHLLDTAIDFPPRTEQFMADYAKKLYENAEFVTARNIGGKCIGIVAFYANNQKFAYISHVWVSKFHRRVGVCGKMLSKVCLRCKQKQLSVIRLEVRSDNESAIRAYKKIGFEFISNDGDKAMMGLHIELNQ